MGGYVHPVLVNGKEIQDLELLSQLKGDQVYVYVDFVKSGRHFYSVKDSQDFYLHRAIIRNREEEIPVFHKKLAFKKKEYSFETSVFADY